MIEAVIFDMDGLLIDSEPFWQVAEKRVFESLGIQVTDEHTFKTKQMTTKEVTEYWYNHHPWENKSLEEVEQSVIKLVGDLIESEGIAMLGVVEILKYFGEKNYKIGLATNSPGALISKVLDKLGIKKYFHSTLSAELVEKGKPSPDVYLKVAANLKVPPSKCIVFEDSISGLKAAKAADMYAIAIPSKIEYDRIDFKLADYKLNSLLDFCDDYIYDLEKKVDYKQF